MKYKLHVGMHFKHVNQQLINLETAMAPLHL